MARRTIDTISRTIGLEDYRTLYGLFLIFISFAKFIIIVSCKILIIKPNLFSKYGVSYKPSRKKKSRRKF